MLEKVRSWFRTHNWTYSGNGNSRSGDVDLGRASIVKLLAGAFGSKSSGSIWPSAGCGRHDKNLHKRGLGTTVC